MNIVMEQTFSWKCAILSFLISITTVKAIANDEKVKGAWLDDWPCVHGELKDGTCHCLPCWTGAECNENVKTDVPSFRFRYDYVEVSDNIELPVYNATACAGDSRCPCEGFVYTISAESDQSVFNLNRSSGELRLRRALKQGEFFTLEITAINRRSNLTAALELTVATKHVPPEINKYNPLFNDGYSSEEEPHRRVRRNAVPTEMDFGIDKTGAYVSTTDMRVGSRVTFTARVSFPNSPVDISVELFTPDNLETMMILCDVTLRYSTATNLQFSTTPTVTMDAKAGESTTYRSDRAVITLGTVSPVTSGFDAADRDKSSVYIDYEVVMIDSNAVNGDCFVSAGAGYLNEDYIWVGQAQFNCINNDLTTGVVNSPSFNMAGPTSMALGTSGVFTLDMFLSKPWADYTVDVFTPLNTTDVMSICAIMFKDYAVNFECGNDFTGVTEQLHAAPSGVENWRGTMNIGTVVNSGSRDSANPVANDRVSVVVVAKMNDNAASLGQTVALGTTVQDGSDAIYVGTHSILAVASADAGTTPTMSIPSGLTTSALEPIVLDLTLTIPANFNGGIPQATYYEMEVLTEISVDAVYKICSVNVVSVGRDLPCLKNAQFPTTYSARVTGGAVPDKAVTVFGYVTNIGHYNAAGDNEVSIQVVVSPVAGHPEIVDSATHSVTIGMTVGTTKITVATASIQISGSMSQVALSNTTAPSFNMAFNSGSSNVGVGAAEMIDVTMTTPRNTYYQEMSLEFITPVDSTDVLVEICSVRMTQTGQNVPCLTPDWYNDQTTQNATFGTDVYDRILLNVGPMCNKELVNDVNEDKTSIALYVKPQDVPGVTHGSEHWVTVGVLFSTTQLVLAQLKLVAATGVTYSPSLSSLHSVLTRNSSAGDIVLGTHAVYSLIIKIDSQAQVDMKITATAASEGLNICGIRVVAVGSNIPCVTSSTPSTYTYHSGTGRKESATLDLDVLKNFGSDAMVADGNFDANSLILEVLVQANRNSTAGTHSFSVDAFYSTDNVVTNNHPVAGVTTTADDSSVNTSAASVGTLMMAAGEIVGGDASVQVAKGETKRVVVTMVVPESTNYKSELQIIVPQANAEKLEICDAAIVSVGSNLPCTQADKIKPVLSSQHGIFTDTVTLDMGYLCNSPLKPGDAAANTIVADVYVRLRPGASVTAGDTILVSAVINVFSNMFLSEVLQFTVTDTFTEKVQSLDGVTNATVVTLDQSDPIPMTIGQKLTMTATITVPPFSASYVLIDLDLPYDDSACLTVSGMRLVSSGANIACLEVNAAKSEPYDAVLSNTFDSSNQMNYGLLDLGIVTNTGQSYRTASNTSNDDVIVIEIDVQMADCTDSGNTATKTISVGQKLATCVIIYDHQVQVTRDDTEQPDLELTLSIGSGTTSTVLYIEGFLQHTDSSTAEGQNTQVALYLPSYQIAQSLTDCNLTHTVTNPIPSVFLITFAEFFFVDRVWFKAEAIVDTTVELPAGFSADYSTTFGEVTTGFNDRSNYHVSQPWYPTPSFSHQTLNYSIDAGAGSSCSSPLGMENMQILDCQITGPPAETPQGTPPAYGRKNGANAWSPFVRHQSLASQRYFRVNFGNKVRVTILEILQSANHPHRVTDLEIQYSNDGDAWWSGNTVDIGPSPADLETVVLASPQDSRQIRIIVTGTTNPNQPNIGLQFEFFGCALTNDVSGQALCAVSRFTSQTAYYWRSFVPGAGNQVYFCDVNPNTIETFTASCQTTFDGGDTWIEMDSRVASLLGYESDEGRVYAYSQQAEAHMVSHDNGLTWNAVANTEYSADALKSTWVAAKEIPWDASSNLAVSMPHADYTLGVWGATYDGLYINSGSWAQKVQWDACC